MVWEFGESLGSRNNLLELSKCLKNIFEPGYFLTHIATLSLQNLGKDRMLLSPSPSNTCYLPGLGSVLFIYASAASLLATSFTRFGTHSSIIFRGLKRKKITRASKTVFRYIQPVIMPFSANSKESRNSIFKAPGSAKLVRR